MSRGCNNWESTVLHCVVQTWEDGFAQKQFCHDTADRPDIYSSCVVCCSKYQLGRSVIPVVCTLTLDGQQAETGRAAFHTAESSSIRIVSSRVAVPYATESQA